MKAIIREHGSGLPGVGDYVPGLDGELYRVTRLEGPIHTGGCGAGHYIHARVELAEWEDCEETDEFPAYAILEEREPFGEGRGSDREHFCSD